MTECTIVAPATGWVGPLTEAPDPVFADLIMGDGLLLDPTEGELRAPCAGEVIGVARTRHSVTMRAHNGAEILLHVGIETVALDGEGFTVHVHEGQSVDAGEPLLSFDLNILAAQAKSLVTPIVIANSDDYEITRRVGDCSIASGDFLMALRRISLKVGVDSELTASEVLEKGASVSGKVVIPLEHGIHARPAARLVEVTKKFQSQIILSSRERGVNARSPVALMGLGTRFGDEVMVSATGADAEAAVQEIIAQISAGLGEALGSSASNALAAKGIGSKTQPASGPKANIEPVALDGSGIVNGTTGAPGLCIGAIVQYRSQEFDVPEQGAGAKEERRAFTLAMEGVRKNLTQAAKGAVGEQQEILTAHLALLDDPVLFERADALINVGKGAGFAWRTASREQAAVLSATGDPLMAERASDLLDLEMQFLGALSGNDEGDDAHIQSGMIIIAEDLLPSQFIRLADKNIGGIATAGGGPTSHVSILAASKGIPLLTAVGPRLLTIPDRTSAILEADQGRMQIAPSMEQSSLAQQAITTRRSNQAAAQSRAHEECFTADGVRIKVFANLGASNEATAAVNNGAEGCGLLRSEFLFLGRATPPSEDEQYTEYQKIADGLDGRPLVIRTLDIGGDKPAPYIDIPEEENPALGLRGIRVSLRQPDLLKTQFRAILRVKSSAPIHIMLPMVVALDELRESRCILDDARDELGVIKPTSLGIMIETPASAVLADSLSREADFFSIGTNDLTQYVLAVDRGNPAVAGKVDGLHPAVLRMIKGSVEAANASGKWVGVCGALAADLSAAPVLIGLGVTELSSTAARLPELKAFIRTINYSDCQSVAQTSVNLHAPTEVRELVRSAWAHLAEWT